MSITVREFVATLGLKVDQGGFQQAESLFGKIASVARTLGVGLAGMFSAAGIVNTIKSAFQEINEQTSRLGKQAPALGLNVQQLQAWEHAANASGVSAESFQSAAAHMAEQFKAMAMGSAHATMAMGGISRLRKDGTLKDMGELLEDVSDKVLRFKDPMKQAAEATRILGGSGAAVLPLLLKGRDGIRELREEVRAFGADLKKEDVDALAAYRREMSRTGLVTAGLKQSVAGPLAQVFGAATKVFNDWVKNQKGKGAADVREGFTQLTKYVDLVTSALKGLYSAAVFVGKWIDAFALGVGALVVVLTAAALASTAFGIRAALAGAVALLPWLAFLAAVVALALVVDEVWTLFKGGETILGKFFSDWTDKIFKIKEAFDAGHWNVLLNMLDQAFMRVFDKISDYAVARFMEIPSRIKSGISAGLSALVNNVLKNQYQDAMERRIAEETGRPERVKAMLAESASNLDEDEQRRRRFSTNPVYAALRGAQNLMQGEGLGGQILRGVVGEGVESSYYRERGITSNAIASLNGAGANGMNVVVNQTITGVPEEVLAKQKQQQMAREVWEDATAARTR